MTNYRYYRPIIEYAAFAISAISFIALCIVIIVFYSKRLNKNLTNQFVMQLIISEMLNNLNHITPAITNALGDRNKKFYERMRVCYTQMFLITFCNLYTLYSSFLIAFRINDLLAHSSRVFKKPKNIKIAKLSSLYFCLILSYLLWTVHLLNFQNYSFGANRYFRVLTCWMGSYVDFVLLFIFGIFIIVIFVYSCKSVIFVSKYRRRLEEDTDDDDENSSTDLTNTLQFKKIKLVQKRLIIYPIVTAILYILIIIFRLLSIDAKKEEGRQMACLILYAITTVFRGMIFAGIYFGTQKVFREGLYDLLLCKKKKYKDISTDSLTKLDDLLEE